MAELLCRGYSLFLSLFSKLLFLRGNFFLVNLYDAPISSRIITHTLFIDKSDREKTTMILLPMVKTVLTNKDINKLDRISYQPPT